MKRNTLTLIVPCYNEEKSVDLFYREADRVAKTMPDVEFQFLFVDDGSKDNTIGCLRALAERDARVSYLSFSRNFGKEAAMYAGLKNAKGDYVVILDADLQHPPALLPQMYQAVTEEGYDSVATRRVSRTGEPPVRSFFSRMFYKIVNKISNTEIVDGAQDFRMMNRKYVEALISMSEYHRFSKGLFGWVGFKNKWIECENVQRAAGESKWSFWKLFKYSLEGIMAFSTVPLVVSSFMGIICCILAFGFTAFIVVRKILFGDPVAGWASTMSVMLFMGGIQFLCIGILSQYMAKTYVETKNRPIYLIGESKLPENEEK